MILLKSESHTGIELTFQFQDLAFCAHTQDQRLMVLVLVLS